MWKISFMARKFLILFLFQSKEIFSADPVQDLQSATSGSSGGSFQEPDAGLPPVPALPEAPVVNAGVPSLSPEGSAEETTGGSPGPELQIKSVPIEDSLAGSSTSLGDSVPPSPTSSSSSSSSTLGESGVSVGGLDDSQESPATLRVRSLIASHNIVRVDAELTPEEKDLQAQGLLGKPQVDTVAKVVPEGGKLPDPNGQQIPTVAGELKPNSPEHQKVIADHLLSIGILTKDEHKLAHDDITTQEWAGFGQTLKPDKELFEKQRAGGGIFVGDEKAAARSDAKVDQLAHYNQFKLTPDEQRAALTLIELHGQTYGLTGNQVHGDRTGFANNTKKKAADEAAKTAAAQTLFDAKVPLHGDHGTIGQRVKQSAVVRLFTGQKLREPKK